MVERYSVLNIVLYKCVFDDLDDEAEIIRPGKTANDSQLKLRV